MLAFAGPPSERRRSIQLLLRICNGWQLQGMHCRCLHTQSAAETCRVNGSAFDRTILMFYRIAVFATQHVPPPKAQDAVALAKELATNTPMWQVKRR